MTTKPTLNCIMNDFDKKIEAKSVKQFHSLSNDELLNSTAFLNTKKQHKHA